MTGQRRERVCARFLTRSALLTPAVAFACAMNSTSHSLNADSAEVRAALLALIADSQDLPAVVKPMTYQEELQLAALRPNRANGSIVCVIPAKPGWERMRRPLVIVDGRDLGDDFNLSAWPDSVLVDIQVLREREAVQKYGARAQGGVVILQTRKRRE
jgi:hypothetical protein